MTFSENDYFELFSLQNFGWALTSWARTFDPNPHELPQPVGDDLPASTSSGRLARFQAAAREHSDIFASVFVRYIAEIGYLVIFSIF